MSGDYSLWKRQDERLEANKGVTGRGIVGCISFLISAGIAYGIYWWLDGRYDLRTELSIPYSWPDAVVTALIVIILFIAIQSIVTIFLGILRKLAGKDQKVEDKLDELYEKWGEQ
jgi:TRAP-type C4-dicarboxylate transport system permease small subunit